jgi:hypothetical protein
VEIVGERVEIRTQRIGGEVLFPQPGGQLRHLAGGMLSYPLQYIHQIVIWIVMERLNYKPPFETRWLVECPTQMRSAWPWSDNGKLVTSLSWWKYLYPTTCKVATFQSGHTHWKPTTN